MTSFFRLILFLNCFALLSACQKGKDDETVVVTTAPEFQVDLFEQRDPVNGSPVFGLWIRSVEKFSCSNYAIAGTVDMGGSDITIHLNEVLPPDSCINGSASAQSFMAIGHLPVGMYHLSIILANTIETEATLTVKVDGYEISVPHPQGIYFQNVVLKKIPEGLIWGYIATPDVNTATNADAFLSDLKGITTESNLEPGFYSYFTLSGTGLLTLHPGFAPSSTSQAFVRQSASTQEDILLLLHQYRSAPQAPVQIRCLTTFGEL